MRFSRSVGPAIAAMICASWICSVPAANAANAADVAIACPSHTAGTTITLTADCTTTVPLTVPNGFTLDGAGHTIFAHDPNAAAHDFFLGSVVQNAGAEMSLRNLTVQGTSFALNYTGPQYGVSFDNASGSITNVHVLGITQHSTATDRVGIAIQIAASGVRRTVTVTGSTASGFQRSALVAAGTVTVDVSHSTFGPPDLTVPNPDGIAQNTVQFGSAPGAGGMFTDNTVIGAAFGAARNISTGMLLWEAADLTISHNTFAGTGTDVGIYLYHSTNITIAYNHIARTATPPGFADAYGLGDWNFDGSSTATLICNTFAGWIHNLRDLVQPPCAVSLHVTKTAVPDPGIAGRPITYIVTVTNGGPSAAFDVTVEDKFGPLIANFTWACAASGRFSHCPRASGTGSIHTAVDVGAGGSVTFTLTGVLPAGSDGDHVDNTVLVLPPPGTADPSCAHGCGTTVVVPVAPSLPLTGQDLMGETGAGTALVAIGGLILLATRRGKRRGAADA